jgi:hypothetical protein
MTKMEEIKYTTGRGMTKWLENLYSDMAEGIDEEINNLIENEGLTLRQALEMVEDLTENTILESMVKQWTWLRLEDHDLYNEEDFEDRKDLF